MNLGDISDDLSLIDASITNILRSCLDAALDRLFSMMPCLGYMY